MLTDPDIQTIALTQKDTHVSTDFLRPRKKPEQITIPPVTPEQARNELHRINQNLRETQPENNQINDLVKDLTGLDLDHPKELIEFLQNQHTVIHDRYGLPSDELMQPGKQQLYINKLNASIDKVNVWVNIGETKNGLAGEYGPDEFYITAHPPRSYRGVITINPSKINIEDGIQVGRILGHEYIHVQQIKNSGENVIRDLKKMEFEAYIGSIIFDENINLRELFSAISRSINGVSDVRKLNPTI